jgi:hypothetical protein
LVKGCQIRGGLDIRFATCIPTFGRQKHTDWSYFPTVQSLNDATPLSRERTRQTGFDVDAVVVICSSLVSRYLVSFVVSRIWCNG